MASMELRRLLFGLMLVSIAAGVIAQDNVPLGIHYQAVARDNYGKEIVNRKISVKFSVISGNPLGTIVYQELHQDVVTSRYGVFSLVIGQGTPTGSTLLGELSQIAWESAYHYLKVEVKFENEFMDMGTIQFLSVPYALFARKSLEPGPAGPIGPAGPLGPKGDQGPKGDPGDPATDDQTLSVVNVDGSDYLAISGGNQVKISNIERDGDPVNEIQDLVINSDMLKITNNTNATDWDLSPYRQTLAWDPATSILSISGATSTVLLSDLKNDTDADPANEIQDIFLRNDSIKITGNPSSDGISLVKYLDDKDNQQLAFSISDNILSLTNSVQVDLTSLKNDADADPANEIQSLSLTEDLLSISGGNNISLAGYRDNTDNQTLSYIESATTKTLSILNGNNVTIDNMVAFRAEKEVSVSASSMTPVTFLPTVVRYNDGNAFDQGTGVFTAPVTGIYSFTVSYFADGSGGARTLAIYLGADPYEELAIEIASGTLTSRSITMKLTAGETVKLVINTGTSTQTGTGSFSGYKVY